MLISRWARSVYIPALIIICGATQTALGQEIETGNREIAVCGWVTEVTGFALWRMMAGRPNPARIRGIPNLSSIEFTTSDKRVLRGYKLTPPPPAEIKGYVLVAQGNATLADQIIDALGFLAEAGLDVYVYDFRGYGNSEGASRLNAILSDYGELVRHLNSQPYAKRFLFGMSFGGIILVDVIGTGIDYTAALIDSSPSELTRYGCPAALDPYRNIPPDASRLAFIAGLKDTVVTPEDSRRLGETIESRNGALFVEPEFSHPFEDSPEQTQRRLNIVAQFFRRFL